MSSQELFRKEVSQVSGAKHYGKVRLAKPGIYMLASGIAMSILLLLALGSALVPVKRRALAYGLIITEQGTSNISTPLAGVIDDIYVREGDVVAPGTPLFKVTNEVQATGVTSSAQSIAINLETRKQTFELDRVDAARRTEQMLKLLHEKMVAYDAEIERIKSSTDLENEKFSLLQRREADTANLAAANFVSKSQVVDRRLDVLNQKGRLEDLGRQLQELVRARLSTSQELESTRAEGANTIESIARSIAALDQELTEAHQRGERVVRSPRSGVVIGLLSAVGNMVNPGQLLAVVVPDQGVLGAEVYVPARSISRIASGMKVELRYEAYPYQKYGQFLGRIASITSIPIQPNEFSVVPGIRAAIVGTEPVYRVNVTIPSQVVDGNRLRPGMALSAAIVAEEKTVWRWLTEDFYRGIK